jgi:uncharacterized protein
MSTACLSGPLNPATCQTPPRPPTMTHREQGSVRFQDIIDQSRMAMSGIVDFASGLVQPTIRLGVTGLSRSGKTVFITALVNALLNSARLPVFEAYTKGIISRAYLVPQPDDDLPRFSFEQHLATLQGKDRHWPEGTKRISQLRLAIEFEPQSFFARNFASGKLFVDIIDYPGEWLLDLPLMTQSYQQWSSTTIAASRKQPRLSLAKAWHETLSDNASAPEDEHQAMQSAQAFTAYLASCRSADVALSTLPPGRFLMPGDLAGSPLLSFAPLDNSADHQIEAGTQAALMARRYDSYVAKIVRPFFFGHFARMDRQIVLVDVLSVLNAGPAAVADLQTALTDVMACFRQGSNNIVSGLFGRKVDHVMFAATKADLLHHASHDRLESILNVLTHQAAERASYLGAEIDVAAIAAIRATREARITQKGEELSCIAGIPESGEVLGRTNFDGTTEAAIFPGDLPDDPHTTLQQGLEGQLKFLRFRPPLAEAGGFPHIRLDRALEFLLGDKLQ